MVDKASRIATLIGLLGVTLPAGYLEFLRSHRTSHINAMISTNPDYWGVSAIFEVGDGPDHLQIDATYRIVGDVLPPRTLPIAQDISGDFYLLDCNPGDRNGVVLWWNHERDMGDHRTEFVAASFADFVNLIVPAKD